MSDLFQDGVPNEFILRCFEVMIAANWHTYQILTKRPERMAKFIASHLPHIQTLHHIWLGVSVEDQKYGVPRIQHLHQTPAAVRFLSIEPLLEDIGTIDLRGIHWVIVGGESGHGARPMKKEWVDSILRQCRAARVPFFFKQWGGVQKKKAGRSLHGRIYDEYPKPAAKESVRIRRPQRLKLA